MLDKKLIKSQISDIIKSYNAWKNGDDFHGFTDDEFKTVMEAKYDYLLQNSSTLFKKALEGSVDMTFLNKMFEMMDKIDNGKVSYFDGSRQIGEILTDHYVKPLLK